MRFALLALLVLSVGCTDSTGPGEGLAGEWSYTAPSVAVDGFESCQLVDGVLDIESHGPLFNGSLAATLECSINGEWLEGPFGPFTIFGERVGATVDFNTSGGILPHMGQVHDGRIDGHFRIHDGTAIYDGTFVAERR